MWLWLVVVVVESGDGGGGNGAVLTVNVQSLVGSITSTGSGYTPGTYNNISWTGSASGVGGTASFTIPGLQGVITTGGSGYKDQGTAYSIEFRNPPTTTYTVTVVQRTKLGFIGTITNGPFQVGEAITAASQPPNTATFNVVSSGFEYNATHHYENTSKEYVDVSPTGPVPALYNEVTIADRYRRQNDALKQIKVIKPENMSAIASAYKKALKD